MEGPGPRLLVVRHGETEENRVGVFQGQRGAGLNQVGRAQIAQLGARLAAVPIDGIWSSDLLRAHESASILVASLPRAPLPTIQTDVRLREVDVGAWTGLSFAEVEARFPEEWAAWRAGLDVPRGGAETYAALARRVEEALEDISRGMEGAGNVLVVSHGAAIKSVVARLLGMSVAGAQAMAPMRNASVTVLQRRRGLARFQLVSWNDTSHLGDPLHE